MRRYSGLFLVALLAFAVPAGASQFADIPFDEVVAGSMVVVQGTLGPVSSSWDAGGDVIFSRSEITVTRYLAGEGPSVLTVREVGGTVGGYTQQAIGFPVLREGEEVVLFLRSWEDDPQDVRIHAYAKGKYLVHRDLSGTPYVRPDRVLQGESIEDGKRPEVIGQQSIASEGIPLHEFRSMINAVVVGKMLPVRRIQE